ncbi:MAG: dihydrolipoamide acetyltransferase family protein [Acidobacteriota bacterium]
MAISIVMPALEMAQETGKLVKWYKQEGDAVAKGDLLMAVETDKAVVEIEADGNGILSNVRAKQDDVVTVGQVIAWLLAPGEAPPADAATPVSGRQATGPAAVQTASAQADRPAKPSGAGAERELLSPKARRLAAELAKAAGQAPAAAAASQAASEAPGQIWRIMAERVTASWTTMPHIFLTRDVDATALVASRQRLARSAQEAGHEKITHTDQLVALLAGVLKTHRRLNASWVDQGIRYHDDVNVGLATAVEQGLVVPVIHGADRLSIGDIARRRREVVDRAQAGRLQPADIQHGTITISNLGMYGIDAFTAIINAPQAAILAIGRIGDRVVARDGQPVVCPQLTITLACDHRVVDGARAAEFLRDFVAAIESCHL